MKKTLTLIALALACSVASAAVTCTEKIAAVIPNTDGITYFTTDKTCVSNWCSLGSSTSDFSKRAFSLMALSQTSTVTISIYWPNISSCTSQNVNYAVPGYIYSQGN